MARARIPKSSPSQPECVAVEHTARPIDTATLDRALAKKLGWTVKGYRNQNAISYEHGYARVEIAGFCTYSVARGWREVPEAQEAWSVQGEPVVMHFDASSWWSDLLDWMADILRTGRTVACGPGVNLAERSRRHPRFGTCSYPWETIQQMVEGRHSAERLDLSPDYQRGAVWTRQQQREFVGFLLDGGECPKIVIQRYESGQNAPAGHEDDYFQLPAEVIDGQQRLRALCAWLRGEIDALTPEGDALWFRDTNEIDRRGLMLVLHYVDLPRIERLRYYIKLNRGGTVHTEQEIARVRALLAAEEKGANR